MNKGAYLTVHIIYVYTYTYILIHTLVNKVNFFLPAHSELTHELEVQSVLAVQALPTATAIHSVKINSNYVNNRLARHSEQQFL